MCGIVGKVHAELGRPVSPGLIGEMCAQLRHRGPDDEGIHVEGGMGIGMRRLKVIDLEGGGQPMCNEDGSVWIVFNGEIYNYRELRDDLGARGHRFASDSDTEAIIHLYEEYGPDCVDWLRGMFAFAIWDAGKDQLLLARDRLGKKPLYYADNGRRLTFASELSSVLCDRDVERTVDPAAVDEYLTYLFVPHPRTIYSEVRKLPPASRAIYAGGQLQVERYWSASYAVTEPNQDLRAAEDQLEEILTESVRLRLQADVPLGAFLSGGLDSSLIVALMQRHSASVKTFTVGFDDASFSELGQARHAAEVLETEHQEFRVEYGVRDLLPGLLGHFGEPFADSSAIPTYHVSRLTREHVTVALSGDGGDEVFGGYRRYIAGLWAALYNHPLVRPPAWVLEGLVGCLGEPDGYYGDSVVKKARRFIEFCNRKRESSGSSWDFFLSDTERNELYAGDFRQELARSANTSGIDTYAQLQSHAGDQASPWLDLMTYLPDDILTKVDRMSMAVSLEVRCPLLDHHVVEFMASQPRDRKFGYRSGKRLLRRVAARHLPPEILRRPKHGFAVPMSRWLKGDLRSWMEDLLLAPAARRRGRFDPAVVERMVRTHLSGRRDLSQQLWALMVLELWFITQEQTLQVR